MDLPKEFLTANEFTKKWEKGYVNHPKDPGGATYNGLCLRLVKDLRMDLNGDGVIDARDIQWLRDNQRQDIVDEVFFKQFWCDPHVDTLLDVKLMTVVYDCNVNCGVSRSVKCLQSALNKFSKYPLVVDGKRGKKTDAVIKNMFDSGMIFILAENTLYQRITFHKNLADRSPFPDGRDYRPFIKGWLNRCNDLLYYIRRMA